MLEVFITADQYGKPLIKVRLGSNYVTNSARATARATAVRAKRAQERGLRRVACLMPHSAHTAQKKQDTHSTMQSTLWLQQFEGVSVTATFHHIQRDNASSI